MHFDLHAEQQRIPEESKMAKGLASQSLRNGALHKEQNYPPKPAVPPDKAEDNISLDMGKQRMGESIGRKYDEILGRICRKLCRTVPPLVCDAEDLRQQTWFNVLRLQGNWPPEHDTDAWHRWLWIIAKRLLINAQRRHAVYKAWERAQLRQLCGRMPHEEAAESICRCVADSASDPAAQAEARENSQRIRQVIGSRKNGDEAYTALRLFLKGSTIKEIRSVLRCSAVTVHQRCNEAVESLLHEYGGHGPFGSLLDDVAADLDDDPALVLDRWRKGMALNSIPADIGLSHAQVRKHWKKILTRVAWTIRQAR
jgi:RNA polymerase sigma factor (sigma-70 family)